MCFGFGGFMPKTHHQGENIHRMEQVPERVAPAKSPDLLVGSRGNLPPGEVKRLTHKTAKRQAKEPKNQAAQK
jgi:hypothetical protein